MPVSLTGTATAFDQTYELEQIAHLIDEHRRASFMASQ